MTQQLTSTFWVVGHQNSVVVLFHKFIATLVSGSLHTLCSLLYHTQSANISQSALDLEQPYSHSTVCWLHSTTFTSEDVCQSINKCMGVKQGVKASRPKYCALSWSSIRFHAHCYNNWQSIVPVGQCAPCKSLVEVPMLLKKKRRKFVRRLGSERNVCIGL